MFEQANPLLKIEFQIPFDRIQAQHVEPAIEQLLAGAEERVRSLSAAAGPRTFANTMEALDVLTEPLDYAMGAVRHLESVATTPELRAAYNAVQPAVSLFYASLPLNEGLWKAIQAYAATEEAKTLTGARARFLKKTIDDFRRHGAELSAADKTRMQELDVELAKATTKFAENVLDATNEFELILTDEPKLSGLPPSAVGAARASAESKGKAGWRFTLQAPSYVALMTYLDDASIRRQVYEAHSTRATSGAFDNRPLLKQIIELRREKAKLLGFQNFADLVLYDRMAHTGAQAHDFLLNIQTRTENQFARENKDLAKFAELDSLHPWDLGYYAEKQRQELYDFDEEILRPYFPLESVVKGMFEIFGKVFGIKVTEKTGLPVWDPGTHYYQIHDVADDAYLGAFYADFFPRENKRGGAWMDSLVTGNPPAGRPHLGLICGNLTPPVGDKPALLTHRDVETIFHEFGHLLHHCLSRAEIRSQAGTNVAWDFVELPSQIMENWCWERGSLDTFARHYETGEPIPEDLFQKMKRARTFRGANVQMRQVGLGVVDLALHREYSPENDGDVVSYSRRIAQPYSPAPLPEAYAMIAGFTHLFSGPVGYAAGYYSYKWAEVLEADAFSRFKKEGVFNEAVGREFRDRILSKGDSEDPAALYRSFMGRDPDPNALLVRAGLVNEETA